MKKLKLILEYHCYPLWLYPEDESYVEENGLIEELNDVEGLPELLEQMQTMFDDSFIDNDIEFSCKEFTPEEEQLLNELLESAYDMIQEAVGDQYEVIRPNSYTQCTKCNRSCVGFEGSDGKTYCVFCYKETFGTWP